MGRRKRGLEVLRDDDDDHPEIPQSRLFKSSKDGQRLWPTPRSPLKKPAVRVFRSRFDELETFESWDGLGDFGEGDLDCERETDANVIVCKPVTKRYHTSVSIVIWYALSFPSQFSLSITFRMHHFGNGRATMGRTVSRRSIYLRTFARMEGAILIIWIVAHRALLRQLIPILPSRTIHCSDVTNAWGVLWSVTVAVWLVIGASHFIE